MPLLSQNFSTHFAEKPNLDLSVESFEYLIGKLAIEENWNGQRSWNGI